MTTTKLLAGLDSASAQFRRHLAAVGDDAWAAPTPCSEWDVRYLVAHVVGGNRFASLVLAGSTLEEAMAAIMATPQLSDAPLRSFDDTAAEQRSSFRQEGALSRTVAHPAGEITAERFLAMRVFDIAVHSWDLGTAIGRDSDLDPELAELVLGIVESESGGRGTGIEPCDEVGPDAPVMERLLDLTGRYGTPRSPHRADQREA